MHHINDNGQYVDRGLSNTILNMNLARHRWYDFKEGFSEALVREAISEMVHSKPLRILDPFSGSGTTLVASGRCGHTGVGIEVNPFLAFAARAKCSPNISEQSIIASCLADVLSQAEYEVPSPLEGKSTFTERAGITQWLFNRSVLRGFTSLFIASSQAGDLSGPMKLALFGALMDCCNAKRDGKCLRYRKGWQTLGLTSVDLRASFVSRMKIVAKDLVGPKFQSSELETIEGDARERMRALGDNSFDIVVTSPPYLNSFDYSDVYRPEMFAGGFVKNNAELRQIRLQTIRSHVQVGWQPAEFICSPMLGPILQELSQTRLWDHRLPAMVQSYFADMEIILSEARRIVRSKGQAWIVVSTSAYGGVHIPVDLIIADIASRVGWRLRGVYVLRNLRAAGQHWSYLDTPVRAPLRESLIVLEK
jgi:DNA modification methylase